MTYEATVLIASILAGALFGLVVIVPIQIWFTGRVRRRPVSRTEQRYTPEREDSAG